MIRTERDGDVALLVLDRPDRRNAMTPGMFSELRREFATIAAGDAGALVLAGNGPVFCGGFDLKMCLDEPGTLEVLLRELAALVAALQSFDRPVVIAAHGAAIAGGCAMLTAADYVVTDEAAKIGYPVVPLGISPAVSAAGLSRAVGDGWCRERLLDPGLITGKEAVRIGLAHEAAAAAGDVRGRAMAVARGLAQKPRGAFASTKSWIREIPAPGVPADASERSLAASLSIVGGDEERARLSRMFERRRTEEAS